jgi:hypothetical protein
MNKKQAAKAAKALEDILSGKAKGWGAANPNFPNGEMINPVYSPSSGNSPIMDPGFNRPAKWTKKLKEKEKFQKSLNLIHSQTIKFN